MRVYAAIIAVFWSLLAGFALAETVTGVSAHVEGANTHLVVTRSGGSGEPKIFQIGGDNPRIVIDWARAKANLPAIPAGALGHVQGVRYSDRGDSGLRVVLDLVPGAKLSGQKVSAEQINLHVVGPAFASPKAESAAPTDRYFDGVTPFPRLKPSAPAVSKIAKNRRPIIVIDAGHGGKDPGSIGTRGTYEKIIVIKAALELQKQLVATGRYQVIMTRDDDTYVDHAERIRIARAGGADLFISIHADSTKGNTARGASVYTLADRAKGRSKGIVNTQNWIMDVDLTEQSDPVGDILVDLAQRKTSSQSEMFADILIANLKSSTRLIGNTHRRAGYFVLLAPDVPAVLLELGFLSNSHDEKLLRSPAHRKKLMGSVVTAINGYFATQKS